MLNVKANRDLPVSVLAQKSYKSTEMCAEVPAVCRVCVDVKGQGQYTAVSV